MASFPPIPPFPQLPFPLPFNFTIDSSRILTLEDLDDDFNPSEVCRFLDCLVTTPVRRRGNDWVISVNRKVYFIKWRDVTPQSPWTKQVWDIYRVLPDNCGCPTDPVGLGWQACWADVIKTLHHDIFSRWQNGAISGSGQTVVAIGTNAFQPATVGIAQVGPVLYLDASDSDSITLDGGAVDRWSDKSTFGNDAEQQALGQRPTLELSSINGLDTIRFDAGQSQFLNLPNFKARADWHLFVVGRFFSNVANPRGTWFAATGLEDSFGGIEGKVYQDGSIHPEGTPFSYVAPDEVPMGGNSLSPGTFGIWEYRETISSEGSLAIGLNAFEQTVFSGDTSEDFWDPTRQTFGEPIPLPAALGRAHWGINPLQNFDYLDGSIGQILLYPRVLAAGERVQVLNVLREKWGLGAPLPFPPNP